MADDPNTLHMTSRDGATTGEPGLLVRHGGSKPVALDTDEKKHINTIAIRPQYRISLRLGDIEALFPWSIGTQTGRLARMQVLGLFHWPLNHRVAAGKTAKPGGDRLADNQAAYPVAWRHFKERFCGHVEVDLSRIGDLVIEMPKTQVGKTSVPVGFMLKNGSDASVQVKNVAASGEHAGCFEVKVKDDSGADVADVAAFDVPAKKSYRLDVRFTPDSAGAKAAKVTYRATTMEGTETYTVSVTGIASTGAAPGGATPLASSVDITKKDKPEAITLKAKVGNTSPARVFLLSNPTSRTVVVTNIALGGANPDNFEMAVKDDSGNPVPRLNRFDVPANRSCMLEVRLKPKAPAAAKTANITFKTLLPGDIGAKYLLKVQGEGTANEPADSTAGVVTDAQAQDELKKRLKEWVVQRCDTSVHGHCYNIGGPTKGGGALPVAAPMNEFGRPAPSEAQGHFAKLRLPGSWPFLTAAGGNHDHNRDTSLTAMGMYDSEYAHETTIYNANPVLGKIPLVACVEKLNTETREWEPLKDAAVYFRLVKPYDLPNFQNVRPANRQLNRPTLIDSVYHPTHPPANRANGSGPRYYANYWEQTKYPPHADNPQVDNCHETVGGKRKTGNKVDGSDVRDILFKMGKVAGFSDAYENSSGDMLPDPPVKRAPDPDPLFEEVEAAGDGHPHAVKTKTNDDGEAGVLFMPSRCAGDRYRIRAYIGPATLAGEGSDGEGERAVRVETGTFVIWRTVRLSRWLQQELTNANQLHSDVVKLMTLDRGEPLHGGANPNLDDKIWSANLFKAQAKAANPDKGKIELPKLDLDTVNTGAVGTPFDGLRVSYARGFCEFEPDPGVGVELLTNDEWTAAITSALDDAKDVGQPTLGGKAAQLDLDILFFREAGHPNIAVTNGFTFPGRPPGAYDTKRGGTGQLTAGTAANKLDFARAIDRIFSNYIFPGFMRYVGRNGYLPGLTGVQALGLTNLEKCSVATIRGMGAIGWAKHYNGAFVGRGKGTFPTNIAGPPVDFGYTSTTLHEFGHCLFKVHAQGGGAGGVRLAWHDSGNHVQNNATKHGTCVMSYRACEGMYCSRCLFQLRGWNIKAADMVASNEPEP
jgi:hypothetical protein